MGGAKGSRGTPPPARTRLGANAFARHTSDTAQHWGDAHCTPDFATTPSALSRNEAEQGLPADEQPLLPTIQHPSLGERPTPPRPRIAGDLFLDGVSNVASFFQSDGDDPDKADDPKAALAAAGLVIKFLVRRIIQTIGRFGRPKRKTVIATCIGLLVFAFVVVWVIALVAYIINYKDFWRAPTWIPAEDETAQDRNSYSYYRDTHAVLPLPLRHPRMDSYADEQSRSYYGREYWLNDPDYGLRDRIRWHDWGYYVPKKKEFKSKCTTLEADTDGTSTTSCTVALDQHLSIYVTGFGKPMVTMSYATDTRQPKTALVTINSPMRRTYAAAKVNVSNSISGRNLAGIGAAMTIKGSGVPGPHNIHIQVPRNSLGMYSLSMRVDGSLNITAGSDTPPIGRLLVAAEDDIDVGPLTALQLALLSSSGSITAQGVQVARNLNLDGREGVIANVSQLYWPTPHTYTYTDIKRRFLRKLLEGWFALVPWWADASSRLYGDSKTSSTILRSNADIQLVYHENQNMDGVVELNAARNVVFSARSPFVSRFRGATGATKESLPARVALSVDPEGKVSDIARQDATKPMQHFNVPYRIATEAQQWSSGLSSVSGKVSTGAQLDGHVGSIVSARSSNGTVTLEFGDNPKALDY